MNVIIDQDKLEGFASYADQHELFDLFEGLISRMVIERPQDPLQWMIDALQQPIGITVFYINCT
jgi:adenylate kinase